MLLHLLMVGHVEPHQFAVATQGTNKRQGQFCLLFVAGKVDNHLIAHLGQFYTDGTAYAPTAASH